MPRKLSKRKYSKRRNTRKNLRRSRKNLRRISKKNLRRNSKKNFIRKSLKRNSKRYSKKTGRKLKSIRKKNNKLGGAAGPQEWKFKLPLAQVLALRDASPKSSPSRRYALERKQSPQKAMPKVLLSALQRYLIPLQLAGPRPTCKQPSGSIYLLQKGIIVEDEDLSPELEEESYFKIIFDEYEIIIESHQIDLNELGSFDFSKFSSSKTEGYDLKTYYLSKNNYDELNDLYCIVNYNREVKNINKRNRDDRQLETEANAEARVIRHNPSDSDDSDSDDSDSDDSDDSAIADSAKYDSENKDGLEDLSEELLRTIINTDNLHLHEKQRKKLYLDNESIIAALLKQQDKQTIDDQKRMDDNIREKKKYIEALLNPIQINAEITKASIELEKLVLQIKERFPLVVPGDSGKINHLKRVISLGTEARQRVEGKRKRFKKSDISWHRS